MKNKSNLEVVVGKKCCGKSYDTFNYLLKQDRVLIFDINDEYNTIDTIELNQINSFKGIRRIFSKKFCFQETSFFQEISSLSLDLLRDYKDGYLLFEDIAKYNFFDKYFERALCKSKNTNLIFHLNSLTRCSKFFKYIDMIRLYDTTDSNYTKRLPLDDNIKTLLIDAQNCIPNNSPMFIYLDTMELSKNRR